VEERAGYGVCSAGNGRSMEFLYAQPLGHRILRRKIRRNDCEVADEESGEKDKILLCLCIIHATHGSQAEDCFGTMHLKRCRCTGRSNVDHPEK